MSSDSGQLAHHFENLEQQTSAAQLGMWAFLATEILFFGGVFTGYAVYRNWKPEYEAGFNAGSREQLVIVGGINTAILLTSSLTMALAVHAATAGRRSALIRNLGLTILLGAAFLGVKVFEYHRDYVEGMVPGVWFHPSTKTLQEWSKEKVNPRQVELYFVFYFVLTGLHALHMVIGMGVLGVQIVLARRGWFPPEYPTPIELSGLYWHFVDIVWIFLFPLLYLLHH